jgi:pimeloyl-ACP methyl ester carboxylesterase
MKIEVTKGVDLYVQDWGKGKPIVFLHGWPYSHRIFEYQMMQLAKKGYRAVGIDLRGYGYSDRPWEGNDYDTWANDVGTVIKHLGLRDVTLVGYCMGGAIAVHYIAGTKDSRVAKLVLASTALPAAALLPDDRKWYDEHITGCLDDQARCIVDFAANIFNKPVSAEYTGWLVNLGKISSLYACIRGLEEMRDRDQSAEISRITIPTRIYHGVYDKVLSFSWAESLQKLIKGSTLVRFENSGHGIYYDEKDKLVDELAKFVTETLAKAA